MKSSNWWNEQFFLSTFEATGHLKMEQYDECKNRVLAIKNAGYDFIEITWKTPIATETILRACCDTDTKVILEDPFSNGKMCDLIRERNADSVAALLDSFAQYRTCIAGVYLYDEPRIEKTDLCAELQNALVKVDETLLPFFALVPSYGDYTFKNGLYTKYVDDFINKVKPKVLSFDYYCFWQHCIHNPLNRNPLWKDLGFWRIKSIETGLPFWWYFQGINFGPKIPENESHLVITPAHWAVQMYSGLAYNAKGLSCYNAYGSIIDIDGKKTHLYDNICILNKKIKKVGNALFDSKPIGIYHTGLRENEEDAYFLNHYNNNDYFESKTKGIIVSIFEKNGKKYLLVVNKCYKMGKNVNLKLNFDVISSDTDITLKKKSDGTILFYLPAGCGALLAEN